MVIRLYKNEFTDYCTDEDEFSYYGACAVWDYLEQEKGEDEVIHLNDDVSIRFTEYNISQYNSDFNTDYKSVEEAIDDGIDCIASGDDWIIIELM